MTIPPDGRRIRPGIHMPAGFACAPPAESAHSAGSAEKTLQKTPAPAR